MNSISRPQITALTLQWRARAKQFMEEADVSHRSADIVRLTAMASTLDWAASDFVVVRPERAGDPIGRAQSSRAGLVASK